MNEMTPAIAEFGAVMVCIGIASGFFCGLAIRWGEDAASWLTSVVIRRLRRG